MGGMCVPGWLLFGVVAIGAHSHTHAQDGLIRTVHVEACDGRDCDTAFFAGDDDRVQTYADTESLSRMHPASGTGGTASVSHTSKMTTPPGGVVRRTELPTANKAGASGTLSASTTAFNYEGPTRARGFGATELEAPFVLDAASTLELTGSWETETIIDGEFKPEAVNAAVRIDLAGDRELTLLRGASADPGARPFDTSLVLMPGTYTISFEVEALSDSTGVIGAALARGDMAFEVTIEPLETCLCETGGDADRVDFLDLMTYVDNWLEEEPVADLDGAGVGLTDLVAFLSCWLDAARGGPCP